MYQLLKISAFAVAVFVVTGCGGSDKPPPYANVSGTVTFNSKPLEKGQITFAVEGRPPVSLDVIDGKFSGQAMSGENRVSVTARKKGTAAKSNVPADVEKRAKAMAATMNASGGGGGAPSSDFDPGTVEMIPPEWGTQSKQVRVIEPGSSNPLQFDIHSK